MDQFQNNELHNLVKGLSEKIAILEKKTNEQETTIKIKETMLMGYCHLKLRLIINILIGMYC